MRTIGVVIHLKRQRVARQTAVADKAQVMLGAWLVGNHQPSTAQQRNLVVNRGGMMGELHEQ